MSDSVNPVADTVSATAAPRAPRLDAVLWIWEGSWRVLSCYETVGEAQRQIGYSGDDRRNYCVTQRDSTLDRKVRARPWVRVHR